MRFFTNNSDSRSKNKRLFAAKVSCVIALYLCVVIIIGFAGCSSKSENQNAPVITTQSTEEIVIDEETYTFSDGIVIGTLNASGKTYRELHEAATEEVNSLIKDFDITVTVGKDNHTFKRENFEFQNNLDEILMDAVRYNNINIGNTAIEQKVFELSFEVDEDSVRKEVAALAQKVDTEPVDATISGAENKKATITKAKDGKKIDQDKLTTDLVELINTLSKGEKSETTTIKATLKTIKPSVTHEDLNGKITLLSSFSTVSTNSADGNHNMKLALDACDGSVIMPGETWSFNACTGNSNLTSLGYRPATVIIGGELVPGIGGGLCQSSTTIYNAAIRTNMEIVERYCHYFQSTYADAGLDATIDWPNLDLKLKNPTDYPMYMQCYMTGTKLYCNIYGYQDPSFDKVEVSSYIYDANYAENYFKAAASRTFYKDGKVVYEEQLPYSTYHYKSPSQEKTTEPTTAAPTKPKPTKPAPTTPAPTVPKTTTPPVTQAPKPTNPPVVTTPPAPETAAPAVTQPVEY